MPMNTNTTVLNLAFWTLELNDIDYPPQSNDNSYSALFKLFSIVAHCSHKTAKHVIIANKEFILLKYSGDVNSGLVRYLIASKL